MSCTPIGPITILEFLITYMPIENVYQLSKQKIDEVWLTVHCILVLRDRASFGQLTKRSAASGNKNVFIAVKCHFYEE